jgi:hypothetical protein
VVEDLFSTFDTSPEVENKLSEMRSITRRVVRIYGVRHSGRRTITWDASGPEFE